MKTWGKIVIVLVIIVAIVAVAIVVINNRKSEKSSLKITSANDLVELVDKIYEESERPFATLETNEIDVSDETMVSSMTGLEDGDDLEYLVVSEPMISSQAYSLVLAKVKSGVNSDKVAKEIFEKINPRKWICVSAEKVCATSSGNVVFLVMTEKENTEKIYDAFKEIAESVGKEYSKDIEDGELPEDTVPGVFEIPEDTDTPVASVDEFGNVIENEVSNEVDNEVSNETEAPENTVNEVE